MFFVLLDGHHLWETEAKVDKDSIKSVSALHRHDSRPLTLSLFLSVSSSSVPCSDVTFAKALQVAPQTIKISPCNPEWIFHQISVPSLEVNTGGHVVIASNTFKNTCRWPNGNISTPSRHRPRSIARRLVHSKVLWGGGGVDSHFSCVLRSGRPKVHYSPAFTCCLSWEP